MIYLSSEAKYRYRYGISDDASGFSESLKGWIIMEKLNLSEAPIFILPYDGDCVNERDGILADNGIIIPVKVMAPQDGEIYVNGKKAMQKDGVFYCDINICDRRTTLTAVDKTRRLITEIVVYYLNEATGKFRLSSDDNILFLKDLNDNKDRYKSIFENDYLSVYKKAHDLYGAKVHLNLFYELDGEAAARFSPEPEYFNLSMMTDKFKDEFTANSDWLKLAFHSRCELPDKPYLNGTAEEIRRDCIAVNREIIRFAGKSCLSDATTTHWGSANLACVRALRGLGYRALTGYFENRGGEFIVSYYVPDELCGHIGERDFYYDKKEDVFFGRIDLVLNENCFKQMTEKLQAVVENPQRGGFVSIMIHEQYFYPSYNNYLPDFTERVLYACKYLYEKGYAGAHICDITSEKHLRDNEAFAEK